MPELKSDSRFRTNADRTANHYELEKILAGHFATRPRAHWLGLLTEASVPCAPIANVEEVTRDPHLAARNMILHAEHPKFDGLIVPGSPLKSTGDNGIPATRAPVLSEGTDEVLTDILGYDSFRLSELRRRSII
jgi:CoA:oxalate CoA-transferase